MTQALFIALVLAAIAACQRYVPSIQAPSYYGSTPPVGSTLKWRPVPRAASQPEMRERQRILESIEERLLRIDSDLSRTRRDLDKPPPGTQP